MTATFTPECLCPLCEENYQPVCSSTGLTHASECQLHRMSCLNNGDDVVIDFDDVPLSVVTENYIF